MKTRKIMAVLLSVLILCQMLVPAMTVSAATYTGDCGDGLTWTVNTSTEELIISGEGAMTNYKTKTAPWYQYLDSITTVTIEEGVTSIGNWALSYLFYARTITLPSTLESIGYNAFYKCFAVSEILVPDSVTFIDHSAFAYCKSMRTCSIPVGVTEIRPAAFYGCPLLVAVYYSGTESQYNAITVDPTNESLLAAEIKYETTAGITWELVDGVLTLSGYGQMTNYKTKQTPWYLDETMSSITKVIVEDGIVTIGNYAFSYFSVCTEIVLPESVVYIGQNAFYRCSKLTTITLPSSIDVISSGLFAECKALTEITIPNPVSLIKASAFYNCTALTTVYFDGTSYEWNNRKDSNGVETGVVVDDTKDYNAPFHAAELVFLVATIEYSYDADTDTLTVYGAATMDDFTASNVPWKGHNTAANVVVSEGVANISTYAFNGFESATSITIPSSVTSIGYYAFRNCNAVESIVLPQNLTFLGSNAFYNSRSATVPALKEITIPKGITKIDKNTFYGHSALTTIYYEGTEEEWDAIEKVTTGNDVLFTANVVYNYQYPTTDPDEPDNPDEPVEFTGYEYADGVLTITENMPDFESGAQPWAEYAADITSIVFAEGVTEIGTYAFENTSIESIILPEGLAVVPSYAFAGCTALVEVTAPASITEFEANAVTDTAVATIYFDGTEEEFQAIVIGDGNDVLATAEIIYTGKPGGGIELPDYDF